MIVLFRERIGLLRIDRIGRPRIPLVKSLSQAHSHPRGTHLGRARVSNIGPEHSVLQGAKDAGLDQCFAMRDRHAQSRLVPDPGTGKSTQRTQPTHLQSEHVLSTSCLFVRRAHTGPRVNLPLFKCVRQLKVRAPRLNEKADAMSSGCKRSHPAVKRRPLQPKVIVPAC
jgi:hypothetical protein